MFNFILKNPSGITPWGKENHYVLHWFGLTDSHYWLNYGEAELFRYHKDFIATYNLNQNVPYVDYQFARIFKTLPGLFARFLARFLMKSLALSAHLKISNHTFARYPIG